MTDGGYLVPPSQDPTKEQTWHETRKRIERFLPDLFREIFPEASVQERSLPASALASPITGILPFRNTTSGEQQQKEKQQQQPAEGHDSNNASGQQGQEQEQSQNGSAISEKQGEGGGGSGSTPA